jgi:hypothetical protein
MLLVSPASALAVDSGGGLSGAISTGAGVVVLLLAAGLLVEMLALRRLAEGSALAENITFAVLATVCLAAAALVSWVGRFADTTFSSEQARLGADLLTVVALAFLGIFFHRVRRAMSRFLNRLTGQDEDLIAALNEDGMQGSPDA